jgi:hypothetical protein
MDRMRSLRLTVAAAVAVALAAAVGMSLVRSRGESARYDAVVPQRLAPASGRNAALAARSSPW